MAKNPFQPGKAWQRTSHLVPTRCVGIHDIRASGKKHSAARQDCIPTQRVGTRERYNASGGNMGRSRYSIREEQAPHFLTCTVINWIPLFTRPQTVDIILNALKYRQENHAWKVYGYVILENHLHLIVQADNLTAELAHFKSYTARQLIDYLKEVNAVHLLKQMAFFRKAHKQDRDYQCWEEGSHPQLIQNIEMLHQKLDYIHLNPVKRGYVDKPKHWRYSSARNYAGLAGLLPVFMDWF